MVVFKNLLKGEVMIYNVVNQLVTTFQYNWANSTL